MRVATATIGQVPNLGKIFTVDLPVSDQNFPHAAENLPAPALAAARPAFPRQFHGRVVFGEIHSVEFALVLVQHFDSEAGINIVGIRRNFAKFCVFLEAFDLFLVSVQRHRAAAGDLNPGRW